jgi:hypothetical protein
MRGLKMKKVEIVKEKNKKGGKNEKAVNLTHVDCSVVHLSAD